jgi:hypothetical protein
MSSSYLTQNDVDNYGHELIDVTQRAALQAVAPHLQSLEQQNAALQRRLAIEVRRRLDDQISRRYQIEAFDKRSALAPLPAGCRSTVGPGQAISAE